MRGSRAPLPQDGKTPYDLAPESAWALRSQLRPPVVSALRCETVGGAVERRRLAEQLGLPDLPPVPNEPSGETTMAKQARQQRELEEAEGIKQAIAAANGGEAAADSAPAATPTVLAPPPLQTMATRLDINGLHPHLLPAQAGNERVLLLEPLSDKARWLACHPMHMVANAAAHGSVDCKLFCWQHAKPRSYVRITENSVEFNSPLVNMWPCDFCMVDVVSKTYFDKLGNKTPFRAHHCSPYHSGCCCCPEPCGQVVAFAPHPSCANDCCACLCNPFFRFIPGLTDADAFVAYYHAAHTDYVERKMKDHDFGDMCGCFHKKAKGK
jgi:hypothetical protein